MVKVIRFLVVVLSFVELLLASGNDQSMDNPCSGVDVRELHSNLLGIERGKRTGLWFGPRLGKRNSINKQHGMGSDEDLQDSVFEVVIKRAIQDKLGLDSSQDVGWIVYLVSG